MRTATIQSIRDNWFSVLYAAWLWTPALVLGSGARPNWNSPVWIAAGVSFVALGAWIVVLMFRRHFRPRVKLSDVTIARASAHAEGVQERIERYRMRLRWAHADGLFNVALPSVLGVFVASLIVIGLFMGGLTHGWSLTLGAALPVTVAFAIGEFEMARLSGTRQVRGLIGQMGTVVSEDPLLAGLASDLDSARVALGESRPVGIAILESSAYNAFAVGRDVRDGMLVVTRALAGALDPVQRAALVVELTLCLRDYDPRAPGDDTRQTREQLLDLETISATESPEGMLGLLRILSDRETTDGAWCLPSNSLSRRSPAAAALIWPLIDLEDRDGQTADRILALDEALRAEGSYADAVASSE